MTRTIGVGVIGLGMGIVHSRAYGQTADRFPDSSIQPRHTICADEVENRAQDAQQRFGFERCTTDWRQVVANPDVEVVNIATPNNMHLEIVQAAAEGGKHIFCEKPVGRNPQETTEIAHAAQGAGVLTFVGFNYRWPSLVQYARQLIQDGCLGALTYYRGRFLMSHVADMAYMLAGPIKRIVSNRETFFPRRPLATPGEGTHFTVRTDGPMGDVTHEEYVGALVQFANGGHGTLEDTAR